MQNAMSFDLKLYVFCDSKIFIDPDFRLMEPIKENEFSWRSEIPKPFVQFFETFKSMDKKFDPFNAADLIFIE